MDKPKPTPTSAHTLEKIVKGADIFLGLSTGWRVEARYDRAHGEGPTDLGAGHPDAGNQYQKTPKVPSRLDHSDRSFGYPNQVNNVLCFPFMFRGHSTRCNDHQRRNEVCGCAGHNRIDRCRAFRPCCDRLRGINVWSSSPLPDINALRSAPHRANCSGRCQGGYGQRRRYPSAEACRAARTGARKLAARLPSIADSANHACTS